MTDAGEPVLAHQPSDTLAAVTLAARAQGGMNTRHAVGLARAGVYRPDPLQQRGVGNRTIRWRSPQPRVVAGRRHAEHARHGRDREGGLVRAHEFEDPDGITPVSRANQAVARERMSRSRRSCLFSRRSRRSSSRSAAAEPPRSSPASPPAGLLRDRPGRPNCGSFATKVRTRAPGPSGHGPLGPAQSSDDETQGDMRDGSWASGKHLTGKRLGVHQTGAIPIPLLPAVECPLGDAHPAQHLRDRFPSIGLLQRACDLLFCEPALLHGSAPPVGISKNRKTHAHAGPKRWTDVERNGCFEVVGLKTAVMPLPAPDGRSTGPFVFAQADITCRGETTGFFWSSRSSAVLAAQCGSPR